MAEYIQRSYIRKMAMLEMAYTMETETDAAVVLRMIEDAPTADVAPVVYGRWIERRATHAMGGISAKCSTCSKSVQYLGNPLKYCPNCGAKMDGGAE